jgi:ATP-dependent DNA helicase RecG
VEVIFDKDVVRGVLVQLCDQPTEIVESDKIEIKGWCRDERALTDKIVDASACLANASGGTLIIGVEKGGCTGNFSRCPHPGVTPDWVLARIHENTHPPVECSVQDISDLLRDITGIADVNAFAVAIPRTKHFSGHVTAKGLSRIRVGRECRPNFSVADDDRSAVIVPGVTAEDLSEPTVIWAMEQHSKKFGGPVSRWENPWEFLAEARLLERYLPEEEYFPKYRVPLASLLLFGNQNAIQHAFPCFETILMAGEQHSVFRKNIVETFRELCGGRNSALLSLIPHVPRRTLHELLVNAFVHRCYRTNGQIVIRVSGSELEIENPGELAPGLSVDNLLYCVPVYRNFLLADGARFIALCDKIGQGINIVFEEVVGSGFSFPVFESSNNKFTARISFTPSAEFREFIRKRGQSLPQLEGIVAVRLLWERSSANLADIAAIMQRSHSFARRLLDELETKQIIESSFEDRPVWRLTDVVRQDIETIYQRDQLDLGLDLFGTGSLQ